ncbi:LysM peptidoglycan-binding domain-containing protein [Isoptericola sp. b441]|uniref:LysM peptidoglycan-binding domain-containing protein n=1 Tax=Actinotalea lenta TaxID=3064654 RepID=A0ABT9D922_9CELL|nr:MULTISPECIES: LysM peptidoglycan-binding domain-containing protein [unclassified Isoptericola]MDO8107403.1 LysM peptidoglycan-binding domain-containing protein [Isoptericola sp. b441]MDO8120934.1 LysM peptidoglycan-binding domain-containing protein [Isoptericola sp. b490]
MTAMTWEAPIGAGPAQRAAAPIGRAMLGGRSRPSGAQLRLTRRGRVVLAVLALLVVGLWTMRPDGAAAGGGAEAVPVAVVTISPGQTLWGIAAGVAAPGQDVRDVVAELISLNGLASSQVRAGQQILVPQD